MRIKPQALISLGLLSVSWIAIATTATQAQESVTPVPIVYERIPDVFDRAVFINSGTYQQNRSILSQFNDFFGIFVAPERAISRDAGNINYLHRTVLRQQVASDPVLRTQDLRNPYDTSVRLLPAAAFPNSRVIGSELVFERAPLR